MSKYRKKPVVIEAMQFTGDMNVILDPQSARAALLAVLDLHREQIGLDDALRYCYDCEEGWPCATVRAINKALNTGGD